MSRATHAALADGAASASNPFMVLLAGNATIVAAR
jgi:hypothetical protein